MERNDCKLVQDLMPLRIDEVCTEETKAFVDEHVAACPECAQIYGYMRATLPQQRNEKDSFKAAMAQFKKTMAWRRIRYIFLGILAAVVLWAVLYGLTNYRRPLDINKYNITLKETENHELLAIWDFGDHLYGGLDGIHESGREDKDGNYIVYMTLESPLLRLGGGDYSTRTFLKSNYVIKDGNVNDRGHVTLVDNGTFVYDTLTPVAEIRLGTPSSYKVLYKAGDTLPMASEQETNKAMDFGSVWDRPFAPAQEVPYPMMTQQPGNLAEPKATPLPASPSAPVQEVPGI